MPYPYAFRLMAKKEGESHEYIFLSEYIGHIIKWIDYIKKLKEKIMYI